MGPDLIEALEVTCMDALQGDPPGPAVAQRLKRDVTALLTKHGVPVHSVTATSTRQQTRVQITLKDGPRVRTINLQVR